MESRLRMRSKALPTMASTADAVSAFEDGLLQISGAGQALRLHHFLKLPAVELAQENARFLLASAEQRRLDMAFERIEGDVMQKRVRLGAVLCAVRGTAGGCERKLRAASRPMA